MSDTETLTKHIDEIIGEKVLWFFGSTDLDKVGRFRLFAKHYIILSDATIRIRCFAGCHKYKYKSELQFDLNIPYSIEAVEKEIKNIKLKHES